MIILAFRDIKIMKDLNELTEILDTMISKQKEKKARTFVAKYKGKNLIVRSGKSSWKAIHHAKSAIIHHFYPQEQSFLYPAGYYTSPMPNLAERNQRKKDFRAKLFELIEIVELTD